MSECVVRLPFGKTLLAMAVLGVWLCSQSPGFAASDGDGTQSLILTRLGAASLSLGLSTDANLAVQLQMADGSPPDQSVVVRWRLVVDSSNIENLFQGDPPNTGVFGALRNAGVTVLLNGDGVAELASSTSGGIARMVFQGSVLPSRYTLTATEQQTGQQLSFSIQAGLDSGLQSGTPEAAMLGVIDVLCPRMAGIQEDLDTEQQQLLTRCSTMVGADQGADADTAGVTDAARQMAPEELAAQSRTGLSIANQQLFNVTGRLARLRGTGLASSTAGFNLNIADTRLPGELLSRAIGGGGAAGDGLLGNGWGAFITGDVFFGDQDETTQEAGFDFKTLGLTAGLDRRVNDRLILGVAAGYASTDADIDHDGGKTDVDGVTLSLYGSYEFDDNFYVDGTLAYGWQDFDTDRRIRYQLGSDEVNTVASGSTDGTQFSASLGAGYDLVMDSGLTVNLTGQLAYLDGDIDGYREKDENQQGLNLDYRAQSYDSLTLALGGSASRALSYEWGILIPELRFAWEHEFRNEPLTIRGHFVNDPAAGWTPVSFAFDTDGFDSDYFRLGLGASAVFSGGRQLFLYYEQLLGYDNLSQGRLSGGVRLEW